MYYRSILDTIGNTPLVQIRNAISGCKGTVLGKVEYFNPGHSVKDRIGYSMIEAAEKDGKLKPGGTIVEGTSGNTGMGLALAALVKGYKCIFTTTDKQSKEKIDMLRALGAKVEVCPTNVEPEDPRSYYSRARTIAEEIPNSIYVNQYSNSANTDAHYRTTGPEIWNQTEGKITHLVAGVGTGGTISGTGRYLKEKNAAIRVVGVDTYGSMLKKFHETGKVDKNEVYPYITEGIGEDIIPACVDFNVIDLFVKVTDKDGALMARDLARKDGLFCGYSSGSAVCGVTQIAGELKDDSVVVVILPDHGSRYVGKIYNDEWMRDREFIPGQPRAVDLIASHASHKMILIDESETLSHAIDLMLKYDISQIPVSRNGDIVGSVDDRHIFNVISGNPSAREKKIGELMQAPFPVVSGNTSLDKVARLITKETGAILVKLDDGELQIITRHDIINSIAR